MKTKSERSPLRISLFFCPNLGEDKKKGLHPHSARFSAQISKVGEHDSILRTILKYLCITGTPKGGHGTMIIKPWGHGINTLLVIVVSKQAYINY